ncbi:MAG: aldose 1-epimerase family protein [Clostridiales bacterium]|nr:aldose 1-epimerase family protein [Candidatus Equinaster intestinalis]
MIKLKNKHLSVKIEPVGAELKSILLDGEEKLWQGEQGSWEGTAPTLFPFCGGLKNGGFTYKGEEYLCDKHGFAKTAEFAVIEKDRRHAVLELKSNEETRKKYPFDFIFRVTFTLLRQSITVKYTVKNTGKDEMYFSCGSHESYLLENGLENYDIIFPHRESLETCLIEQGLIGEEKLPIIKRSEIMPLYEKYLQNDSLVFENTAAKKLILRNRTNGKRIKIEFPDFKYLVIWSLPGKNFVCIEPWAGFPDRLTHTGEIEKKQGMIRLRASGKKTLAHKITFLPTL